MAQKFVILLPTLAIVAGIIVFFYLYFLAIKRHYGDSLNSIDWVTTNARKLFFLISLPAVCVQAPIVEELIYRLPLILILDSTSEYRWTWTIAASVLFSLVHLPDNKFLAGVKISQTKTMESDDLEAEADKIQTSLKTRIVRAVAVFPLGLLTGYFAVSTQSIWPSIAIHAIWNFLCIAGLQLIIILIFVTVGFVSEWLENRMLRKSHGEDVT